MTRNDTTNAWASTGSLFAAVMLIMLGLWQIFAGIAAIAKDEFFVVARGYLYNVDVSAWGWIHLLIGILAVLAGFALFSGATWARAVGIGFAALSATANFFFLPYYPFWAILMIALAIFVIWALAAWSPRAADML